MQRLRGQSNKHSRSHVLIQHDYTMLWQRGQVMVYEVLKVGEKNALSPEYLRATFGFKSVRALQKQIEKERGKGKVILSSTTPPGGYYLPDSPISIRKFCLTLENRANRTLDALNGAKALLEEFEKAEKA